MNFSSYNGETTISCAKYHIRIPTMIHGQNLFGPEISWLNHETTTHQKNTKNAYGRSWTCGNDRGETAG